jgi:hypothetical protein
MTLQELLLDKYQNNLLAQVYLVKYPKNTLPNVWVKEFIHSITTISDDPDILIINIDEKDNAYKVESSGILSLNKFLNFRPIHLKKKFIFINDAHLLGTFVSNKLLKIFEELSTNFCLFLLAPQDETLLPTVESRSINLLIPASEIKISVPNESIVFDSAIELLASLKNNDNEDQIIKNFIENCLDLSLKRANYQELTEQLINLQHYTVSENFNNSKLSRLSLFFTK